MTAPKFRYLIITEDDEVYGTNDQGKATAYADDLCTVVDLESMTFVGSFTDDQGIDEAPVFDDGMNEIDGLDPDA